MDYVWNEQAENIAGHIIPSHHPRLEKVKIAHLFKVRPKSDKPRKLHLRDGKKLTLAKTSKVSDKNRVLMEQGFIFIIEYDQDFWDQLLTLEQQEALVDHELMHCGNDMDGYYLRTHDLEEFRDIVTRHGFWKDDIKAFVETTQKRLLFGEERQPQPDTEAATAIVDEMQEEERPRADPLAGELAGNGKRRRKRAAVN